MVDVSQNRIAQAGGRGQLPPGALPVLGAPALHSAADDEALCDGLRQRWQASLDAMAKASAACEAEADRIAPIEVEVPPELLAREMDISGSVRRHWVMRCAEIDQAYERDVHWRRENADERKATRLAALEKYEASLAGVRVVLARLEGEFEKACNAKCEVADEVMASPSTSPAFIELKLAVICEMIEPGELNWNEIALLKLLDQLRGHAAMPGERVKS